MEELKKSFEENFVYEAGGDFYIEGTSSDMWAWITKYFTPKAIPLDAVVKPESNGQTKYAIKRKDKFMLMQVSNSEKQLNEKIEQAYWLARGIQPKGSNYTKEDFMEDVEKVKVTFEVIE